MPQSVPKRISSKETHQSSKVREKSPQGRRLSTSSENGQRRSSKIVKVTSNSSVAVSHNSSISSASSEKILAISTPVEAFLTSGILDGRRALLHVSSNDTIGSVVEQLMKWRLRSCIVDFDDRHKEFFDCVDLMMFLLRILKAGDSGGDDWDITKKKLRQAAESPVRAALQVPRGAGTFQKFESHDTLEQLLLLLRTRRRVPIYRGDDLVRIVTPTDVLEMCNYLSSETRSSLEIRLTDMLSKQIPVFSELEVSEDSTTIEVMATLKERGIDVVPVVESSARTPSATPTPTNSGNIGKSLLDEDSIPLQRVLGQFDVGALRIIFVRTRSDANGGWWWWEDEAITVNTLVEPCMDFLAHVPALLVSQEAQTPYNMVTYEESLARTISRTLASNFRSVVVSPIASHVHDSLRSSCANNGDSERRIRGTLTTRGIVTLMLDAGLFSSFRFDVALSNSAGGLARAFSRKSTLAKQVPVPQEELTLPRKTTICFSTCIEVDQFLVPVCTQHEMNAMRFVTADGNKLLHDLLEYSVEHSIVGAVAQCVTCREPLGRIALKPAVVKSSSPKAAEAESTAVTFFELGAVMVGLMTENSLRKSRSIDTPTNSTPSSCLKKKTKLLPAPEEQQGNSNTDSMILGFCCSPCASGTKDKITASAVEDKIVAPSADVNRAKHRKGRTN